MLLDEARATPFSRMWCVFELYITTVVSRHRRQLRGLLFDIGTIIPALECENILGELNERCAGILLEKSEFTSCGSLQDDALRLDISFTDHVGGSSRAWFPASVSKRGFMADVREGQATNDGDRKWILGIIKGREDEVNLAVQRKLYRSALHMSATARGSCEMLEYVLTKNVVSRSLSLRIVAEDGIVADTASAGDRRAQAQNSLNYQENRKSCLQYLLEYGCDPYIVSNTREHGSQFENFYSPDLFTVDVPLSIVHPLENACAARNYEHVRIMLHHGSDPDFKHKDNTSLDERISDIKVMTIMRGYKSHKDATIVETALKKHWAKSVPFKNRLKAFFAAPAWICK
jgi:hypothetical protein